MTIRGVGSKHDTAFEKVSMLRKLLLSFAGFAAVAGLMAWSLEPALAQDSKMAVQSEVNAKIASPAIINIWPQLPFVRGKDLCQYHDAYGRTKSEQMAEITETVRSLLREGVESKNLVSLLITMENQISQQRTVAGSSPGMDVMLGGTLKASLDKVYRDRSPSTRRFNFFNPSPLNELMRQMRDPQRHAVWDPRVMQNLSGVAYGTYSYAPNCRGELRVTLHVDLTCGFSYNFQAQGFPDQVMHNIAQQIFETFQHTQFPSQVKIGGKQLELLGSPGGGIGRSPTPKSADMACKAMQARLPTEEEYEYLSNLGDWNGGVTCTRGKLWAMAGNMVMAPDLRNPSPVRSASQFPGQDFSYYCVR
jgi:hypothetical protein